MREHNKLKKEKEMSDSSKHVLFPGDSHRDKEIPDKKTKLPPKGTKDAIHVATLIVSSKHILFPGDSVKFLDVGTNQVEKCERTDPMMIGIVNPFGSMVMGNMPFDVFVKPNTVTKLRHSWDFPMALVPKENKDDDDDGEYQSSDWGDECKGC